MSAFSPLGIGLTGFGKMGQAIYDLAAERDDVRITRINSSQKLEPPALFVHTRTLGDVFADPKTAVVMDFTYRARFPSVITHAFQYKKPLVCGTTGLFVEDHHMLKDMARHIPILQADNMSHSMVKMREVVRTMAAGMTNRGFKCEIEEIYNAKKADPTSGTALLLAKDIVAVGGSSMMPKISSRRIGDHPGTHIVTFTDGVETIRMEHSAELRMAFARGAIEVALWIVNKPPGLYNIEQVFAP